MNKRPKGIRAQTQIYDWQRREEHAEKQICRVYGRNCSNKFRLFCAGRSIRMAINGNSRLKLGDFWRNFRNLSEYVSADF